MNPTMIRNPIFGDKLEGFLQNADSTTFLGVFLPNLITLIFIFGAVAFLFMFLVGALQWILSGGDKGKVEAARGRITSALIGIVLLLSTYAIIKLVELFFGISILSIDIDPLFIK